MSVHDEMSDSDVLRAASDALSGIPMANSPDVEAIVARGRARRRRRLIPGVTGALALTAGAILAVTTLAPASHQPTAQLAAWTVAKQADGAIYVTIRELRDPAGLQRALRADGVPASVSVARNPSCQGYPFSGTRAQRGARLRSVSQSEQSGYSTVIIIHPSALPSGGGIEINAEFQPKEFGFSVGLVQASQQCTGS